ncbi:AraC family transcriptional regulator [Streptomyces sp. NPDC015131]|uniref:helix-turn-helix transcriptional regulator n=1 Tax=Streptomyces sp. NPDC015131 TaxID=3364941 RepID=UPI0037031EF5
MADGVDDGFLTAEGHPTHVHAFHQFLFVPVGRVVVAAGGAEHELSASVGLWVPAGVPHSARFSPDSLVLGEGFDAERHWLPYAAATPVHLDEARRRRLLGRARVSATGDGDPGLFAVLTAGPEGCLPLPDPVSATAVAVAARLRDRPGDPRTVTDWAQELYTSSTSLRRAFRTETGLAFTEWRTRLRLNRSLELLEQGQLVGVVAARVGFTSTNGYILAFRRHFGRTPGAYLRELNDGAVIPGGPAA